MASQIRIGISGWRYPPWRGTFYPKDLAQRRELEYASRQVNSIEINGSFYSLQRPTSYERWYDETPDDFIFAVKGGRYITHLKQLHDIDTALSNFFASGIFALKEKLGPFLWQFPPRMKWDRDRFENFFKKLPKDPKEAAKIAKKHSSWMNGYTKIKNIAPLRHAIEIRNESFNHKEFFDLLRKYNIALVIADTAGKWPLIEEITADFLYLRLHGDKVLYTSGYTEKALDLWAKKITKWKKRSRKDRDTFVYFDNDVKIRAPFDAISLLRRLSDFTPASTSMPLPKIKKVPTLTQLNELNRSRWPKMIS